MSAVKAFFLWLAPTAYDCFLGQLPAQQKVSGARDRLHG